eukprot:3951641-Prymnesium_polylepis.1
MASTWHTCSGMHRRERCPWKEVCTTPQKYLPRMPICHTQHVHVTHVPLRPRVATTHPRAPAAGTGPCTAAPEKATLRPPRVEPRRHVGHVTARHATRQHGTPRGSTARHVSNGKRVRWRQHGASRGSTAPVLWAARRVARQATSVAVRARRAPDGSHRVSSGSHSGLIGVAFGSHRGLI